MPISWSCGLTRCAIPIPQRRWRAGAFPSSSRAARRWEGGYFSGSEDERLMLLRRAWDLGAEYVDVEHAAPFAPLFLTNTLGRRVVLSLHDFAGVPRDLGGRVAAMRETPAEVIKVAVATARLTRCARGLRPAAHPARARSSSRLDMGTPGIPTRVLASRVGSCWTYAGDGWAPGQVPIAQLRDTYRVHTISRRTAIYGVVGRPIGHSLSPAMHNAAFAAEGIDAVYLPLEAADAEDFLTFARAVDLQGASVTAPFKVTLARHVDPRRGGTPGGRAEYARERRVRLACHEHGRRGVPGAAPAEARIARLPRRGARCRRRGACRGARPQPGRRPRHAARTTTGTGGADRRLASRPGSRLAAGPGQLGLARQRHSGRHRAGRGGYTVAGRALRRRARLRPRVQPARDPAVARGGGGRLPTRSGGSTCSWRRRSSSSGSGRDACPMPT